MQNAIDLAHALGLAHPKGRDSVGGGDVSPKIRSTIDAAALCKMADRGQITGGILDGPLAFDNAVSEEAAKTKGIVSPVAGQADIFVVPDLEAGNMLAKQLEYLAEAEVAGIVLGARVPIILTSRADKTLARLGSCAIALLLARHKTEVEAVSDAILVLNAGSSSIKFALFPGRRAAEPEATAFAKANARASATGFISPRRTAPERRWSTKSCRKARPMKTRSRRCCAGSKRAFRDYALVAAGHRVVHGGARYTAPVRIDAAVIAELRRLIPLAPLHQPHHLAAIAALAKLHPALPQIACFDTAFHHTQPEVATDIRAAAALTDEGIRRYGFHGLSYEYIASVLPEVLGPARADGRVVVAHLGSGASMCAMQRGKSVATTMGFTALDGLPMGRRCGNLDPGVVLYLMQQKGMSARRGQRSSLPIVRTARRLRASATTCGRCWRATSRMRPRRSTCSSIASGASLARWPPRSADSTRWFSPPGSASTRRKSAAGFAGSGLARDRTRRGRQRCRRSADHTAGSRTSAWVIPTDEDLMIARHTWSLTSPGGPEVLMPPNKNMRGRDARASQHSGRLMGKVAHQQQDQENHNHEAEAAAAVISGAVERSASDAAETPSKAITRMIRIMVPIDI